MLRKLQLGFGPSTTYTMTDANMFKGVQEDTTSEDDSKDPFYGIAFN